MNEYIVKEIKELTLNSTIESAEKICNEIPITHVPIVEENRLIGCFLESDVRTIEKKEDTIEKHRDTLVYFYAKEEDTVLDLLAIFSDNDTNIVPVLNKEKEYMGYYELIDVLDAFNSGPFQHQQGIVITVERLKKEFSISEIAQIVESNNAKLLGVYISNETPETYQGTLKVSSEDVNAVIQTFRRYNYNVVSEHRDDSYLKDLKNRSDYLQKYLDM